MSKELTKPTILEKTSEKSQQSNKAIHFQRTDLTFLKEKNSSENENDENYINEEVEDENDRQS